MVAVAIVAILAAVAFPNFQHTLRSNRVATSTNELIATLSLARSEAVRNPAGAVVCPSANGSTCGGTWNDGWIVHVDRNNDGVLQAEEVLRYRQGNPKMVVTGPAATLDFDSRGRAGTAATFTLRPDECGGEPMLRTLQVSATGQIRKQAALGGC